MIDTSYKKVRGIVLRTFGLFMVMLLLAWGTYLSGVTYGWIDQLTLAGCTATAFAIGSIAYNIGLIRSELSHRHNAEMRYWRAENLSKPFGVSKEGSGESA